MVIKSNINKIFLEKNLNLKSDIFEIIFFNSNNSRDVKFFIVLLLDTKFLLNNKWLNECIIQNAKLKLIHILKKRGFSIITTLVLRKNTSYSGL